MWSLNMIFLLLQESIIKAMGGKKSIASQDVSGFQKENSKN